MNEVIVSVTGKVTELVSRFQTSDGLNPDKFVAFFFLHEVDRHVEVDGDLEAEGPTTHHTCECVIPGDRVAEIEDQVATLTVYVKTGNPDPESGMVMREIHHNLEIRSGSLVWTEYTGMKYDRFPESHLRNGK